MAHKWKLVLGTSLERPHKTLVEVVVEVVAMALAFPCLFLRGVVVL